MFRTAYNNWCNSSNSFCGSLFITDTSFVVYFNDYNGNTLSSSKYSVESYNTFSGEHVRNVNILRTQPTDAGNYVCYDVNTGQAAVAKLAVIGQWCNSCYWHANKRQQNRERVRALFNDQYVYVSEFDFIKLTTGGWGD